MLMLLTSSWNKPHFKYPNHALSFSLLLAMPWASQRKQPQEVEADYKKRWTICSLGSLGPGAIVKRESERIGKGLRSLYSVEDKTSALWYIGSLLYPLLYSAACFQLVPPFPFPFLMVPPRLKFLRHLQSSLYHQTSWKNNLCLSFYKFFSSHLDILWGKFFFFFVFLWSNKCERVLKGS